MKAEEKRSKALEELLRDSELGDYYNDYLEFESADDLIEALQERIYEQEIIYYSNAMKYLSENDTSLLDSLEIASEMGYEVSKLSSEILATLLYQKNLQEELSKLQSDIEDIFEKYEEQ